MLLLIVVAFVAGLVTAVSPCVLPILPIVLATGAGGDRRRPYLVIAGLIASFSFFTLASVQLISALHLPRSKLRAVPPTSFSPPASPVSPSSPWPSCTSSARYICPVPRSATSPSLSSRSLG